MNESLSTLLARASRSLLLPTVAALAGPVVAQNLLGNGNFTGSLAPWTTVAGSPANLAPYSTSPFPAVTLPMLINGGGQFLADGGGSVVEQVVAPAMMTPGMNLVVSGYLGGFGNDEARLAVEFRDGGGTTLLREVTPYVTQSMRNFESVLLRRELVAVVPAGAIEFAVRVEFADYCCGGAQAAADNVTAVLVNGPVVPAPVALGTELLVNAGFESGWTSGSPLNPDMVQGWLGAGSGRASVLPYSDTPTVPRVPTGTVSCVIDGAAPAPSCGTGSAGNLLVQNDSLVMVQRIDLRGNANQIASSQLALRCSAFLGGAATNADTAEVRFSCLDVAGQSLAAASLAPVEPSHRNYETVLVRREREIPVPPATRFVEVRITCADYCCGEDEAAVDNVSAMLVQPTALPMVPQQTNLVSNGSFENGSIGGSPLELTNADGWFGVGSAGNDAVSYGIGGTPPASLSQAHALGGLLLRDGGNSILRQVIDLRGSATQIGNGLMAMEASAWLGGEGSSADTAEVRIRFETIAGVQTGLPIQLGPVTAAMRGNQTTLLHRESGPFAVPTNAARVVLDVICTDLCCGGPQAMADDIRLVAFDASVLSSASPYPGTGGDLVLMTGVNAVPTTGIGQYVKEAEAGDVLWLKVASPLGTLNGSLLFVGANGFPTAGPAPIGSLPGLALDLSSFALLSFGGPLFPPVVAPLPIGNQLSLVLPPAFSTDSLLLQAVCLPLPGGPVPPNGIFFASEGHVIR